MSQTLDKTLKYVFIVNKFFMLLIGKRKSCLSGCFVQNDNFINKTVIRDKLK